MRLLELRDPLVTEIERIDALLVKQRSGACTIEQAVESFVAQRGADPAGFAERYKALCLSMVEAFVVLEPGARELCKTLHERRVPHAILTNGWAPLQQRKAQAAGFRGPVIVSAEIGTQKPSREAFAALGRTLGVEDGAIAFVGDAPESDVAGAIAAGMQGIWFDAEGQTYPGSLPAPSQVIHSLAELYAFL